MRVTGWHRWINACQIRRQGAARTYSERWPSRCLSRDFPRNLFKEPRDAVCVSDQLGALANDSKLREKLIDSLCLFFPGISFVHPLIPRLMEDPPYTLGECA